MKVAKDYNSVPTVYYRPEIGNCLECESPLKRSHRVWSKYIIQLAGTIHAVSMGYRCPNDDCSSDVVYRSALAEALSLKYYSFGMDVIARIGEMRFGGNKTLGEIHSAGAVIISDFDSQPNMIHGLGLASDNWTRIQPPDPWPEEVNYPESVFHRRSRRNFVRQALKGACLNSLMQGLCASDNQTVKERSLHHESICTGFLCGNAEGFESGFYVLDTLSSSTAKIDSGSFIEPMARICLNQSWLANAAVHFVFMTNLDALDLIWGPRGYRYAMMAAGRLGERLYLMATAMGLGCCGIGAFYDMEAAEILGLKNASRLLYLVAVGPVKKS